MDLSPADLDRAFGHHRSGRLAEAEALYRDLLRREPDNAEALHLLGMLVHEAGRAEEAISYLTRAVELSPAAAVYRSNLAGVLGKAGRHDRSLAHLREAVRLRPDFPEAHNNVGVALEATGRPEEAAASYREALRLRPEYPEAHNHLGNALRKLGRVDDAVESHRRAIALRPSYADAHNNLASSLSEQGRLGEALAALRREVELKPDSPASHSGLLYTLHYHPAYDRPALFAEHREWDRRHGQPLRRHWRPHDNDRSPGRRLRVAYVSPDFRQHTVPRFIEAALARHDRDRFEVVCYSDVVRPDATTARLRALGHAWRDVVRLHDAELAELIRSDRIDVLVDLRGHGAANRLPAFARGPAPVQVTMVGYFDTTGMSAIGYRVTDAVQDPVGIAEAYHTERLLRLPTTAWCYRPDPDPPAVSPLPAERRGYVTFGCLNKVVKVTRRVAAVWARILSAVPRSRLLLPVAGGDANGTVRAAFCQAGIPADRLDLPPKARSRQDYLARYNEVDIALDTFPFNGITTTCDALWMGVPAVTLAGDTSVARAGASLLCAVGLSEFVADSGDGYVAAASALAHDTGRLRSLRLAMRDRMLGSTLCDGGRFTASLEDALAGAWRAWAGDDLYTPPRASVV